MHILFVHQNYPAQFGHIARYLVREHGCRCTFVSEKPGGWDQGVEMVQYEPFGMPAGKTDPLVKTFASNMAHAHGVFRACKRRFQESPDLVVGHSGFGSTLFLKDLFGCPIINYFEYFYQSRESDHDFRPEFPTSDFARLRSPSRNAMILLDLHTCAAGYSPTRWQRETLPAECQYKLRDIFDGIDTTLWYRRNKIPRVFQGKAIPEGTRIVTYVSRGFESMRGFDIFLRAARRIYREYPNVLFLVVGEDRVAYGGDLAHLNIKSFKSYAMSQDDYDPSKFLFLGRVTPDRLADIFSISDLHLYFTVPFVLSWSLFNALACGATVLASDTGPVRGLITDQWNGFLAGFYDIDGIARKSVEILKDPEAFRTLGQTGRHLIEQEYSLEKCLPRMLALYREVLTNPPAPPRSGALPPGLSGLTGLSAAAPGAWAPFRTRH